jgi:hypothetical protein
VNLRHCYDLCI